VSLRSEIHEAFDELGPRNVGLEERVLATVAVERRAKLGWTPRLRAPLSLVAVVLVIAVVAGALMGGRLLADWKRFTAPPAPAVPQTPLQRLEARPLHLPKAQSVAECPAGPFDKNGSPGVGPVHMAGSAVSPETAWGAYFENLLYADGPIQGPILVRGGDLINSQRIVFVGPNSYGPIVGTDEINGNVVEQHLELVIQDPAPPYSWVFTSGWPKGTPECVGWQVDGPGFTEVFS